MKSFTRALLSFLIVAAVSAALLWGGDYLTRGLLNKRPADTIDAAFESLLPADRYEAISDVKGAVTKAFKAVDGSGNVLGYAITTEVQGYGGKLEVHTAVAADRTVVTGIRIGKHQETPGYGAKVAEARFTDQFAARKPPFSLREATAALSDGTYRAAEAEYDSTGFRNTVELTVTDGEITAVNWDAEQENGKTKKELSREGDYVMSETGLPWHKQAEILELVLLDVQDPSRIVYEPESGKTDAYSGATISISPFVLLADEALDKARRTEGSAVDGVSGATTSSRAVITAVNEAVTFAASLAQ